MDVDGELTMVATTQASDTNGNPHGDIALSGGKSFKRLERPSLEYTPEVAQATAPLYEKVKHHIPHRSSGLFTRLMSMPSTN